MAGLVTLLTDFGLEDPYVGVMKGVMLRRAPDLKLVDLTHQIPPQNVRAASFWLGRSYEWFPRGSVHLVVVDPGVGSERRAVALAHAGHFFVGPDNGVFGHLGSAEVVQIEPQRLALTEISRTFHGRDVFAPVAAGLASGQWSLADLGPVCELEALAAGQGPELRGGRITGSVVVRDHFGNLISDIEGSLLGDGAGWRALIAGRTLRVVETYAQAEVHECVALEGSFGTLEVAVRDGSAAELLGAGPGEQLVFERD